MSTSQLKISNKDSSTLEVSDEDKEEEEEANSVTPLGKGCTNF